ncbi:MAG: hypothetical protein EP303_07720 [Deltaproteobacteria bacterium]|nr:MAG: hypothetical protein EP303_07720 [Deltaproteobacteria bacterium]
MKRPLHVVGDSSGPPPKTPVLVTIGGRVVSVLDTGDGAASLRFVDALLDAGVTCLDSANDARPDLRIVIRGAPRSAEARLRAEVLEEAADVVLGSARPAFARHFGSTCARWVNS